MGRIVNMNGTLIEPERAFVSVFDRGFLYGDSVYEVVRTYRGRPFELEAHLDRLLHSAELIGLPIPWPRGRIASEVQRTIDATGNGESYARVIVTRGAGEIGLDPGLARDAEVIIIAKELVTPPPEAYERGVTVALVGVRRNLREAIDPAAKTGNYLNNVLAMKQARELNAFEALMLDRDGRVTEATTANVFLVRGGAVRTPPLEVGILEGVTRRVVLAIARAAGLDVQEASMWPADLIAADEVFITSTTRELVPVVAIHDGVELKRIGSGKPGSVTLRLLADFRRRALGR